MTYDVIIANAAHQSIERNALWWAMNHSYDAAITWQKSIYEQLQSLDTMPQMHSLARENDEFPSTTAGRWET